jgi:hypothetical protein
MALPIGRAVGPLSNVIPAKAGIHVSFRKRYACRIIEACFPQRWKDLESAFHVGAALEAAANESVCV